MIDEAVVDLMQWIEGKAAERKVGKIEGTQPGKGETWVPRYADIGDILAEIDGTAAGQDAPLVDSDELAALIAAMEADVPTAF